MAKKCCGAWDSEVKENPDGFFVLFVDHDNGEISGFHDVGGHRYPVWGLCRDGFFSGHRIDIWEPRSGERVYAFHYFGKIKLLKDEDKITENGKRRELVAITTDKHTGKIVQGEDDPWVGTQST